MDNDLEIGKLIIEVDREEHIAKHNVLINEALEIISGDYVYIKGKFERWLLIGKTKKKRFLTIVVGERREKNVFGLVSARPSRRDEKSFYDEYTLQGGGENDKS